MDYYLKAADEAALYAALESAGVLDAERMVCTGYALDIIGTIHEPTGRRDAEGNPLTAPIPGYHANLRGELSAEQAAMLPVIDTPGKPVRVWA
jgi:hypothetical protein